MAAKAEQLDRARARWRSLRLQRSSLSQKLTTLGMPSSHSQVPNAAPVPSIHRFAGCNLYRHCNDLLRRSQLSVASRGCIKLKLQRSTFPTTAAASSHDEYKPLSTYLRLEPISFASVSKFLHLRGVGQSPTTFNLMPHAICEYQQSVATAAGVSVSDICWFQQWPSETLDCLHPPSLTTGAASPECTESCTCYVIPSERLLHDSRAGWLSAQVTCTTSEAQQNCWGSQRSYRSGT